MKKILCFFAFYAIFCFSLVSINASESPIIKNATEAEIKDILEKYLKSLSEETNLSFNVIVSRENHYDNGTIKQVDAMGFAFKAENTTLPNDFKLEIIKKNTKKKIVKDGRDKGVRVTFPKQHLTGKTQKTGLSQISGVAFVTLHKDGFSEGLRNKIDNVILYTENVAVIQVLERFKNGNIKRNTTTTINAAPVTVLDYSGLKPEEILEATLSLRKAYKTNIKNRGSIIAELFEQNLPEYTWQVVANSDEFFIKSDVMVKLAFGKDQYHILGKNYLQI